MASFDFADSAARSYKFLMIEHEIIGQMAVVPILLKVASFLLVTFLKLDYHDFLLQGVLLAPGYFAEGWLLSHLARLAFFGEREMIPLRQFRHSGALLALGGSRARGILAGSIIYLLIKLTIAGLWALMIASGGEPTPPPDAPQPTYTADVYLAAVVLLIGMIWCFRFLWIFIPAALDYSVADFLKKIKGFMSSLYMIGIWILCYLPPMVLLKVAIQGLTTIFPDTEAVSMHDYAISAVSAVIETLISILVVLAMTFAFSSFYKEAPKNQP